MTPEFKVITTKTITLLPSGENLVPDTTVKGEKYAKYEGIYVERIAAPKPEVQAAAAPSAAKPSKGRKKSTK